MKPILQKALNTIYKVLNKYFKELLVIRYSFVTIIIDPWYKLTVFEYLFATEEGLSIPMYKKEKAYFESVYSKYKSHTDWICVYKEEEALYDDNNTLIEAVVPDKNDFSTNLYYSFNDFIPMTSSLPLWSMNTSLQDEVAWYLMLDWLLWSISYEQIWYWWIKH